MTGRDLFEVEESVVATRSSVGARVAVAFCLVVGLVAGIRWVANDDNQNPKEEAQSETPSPSTSAPTTVPWPTVPQTKAAATPIGITIAADARELALGAPVGTRVAYGIIDGGLRVVDLSDGASFDIATIFPLGMTTNYLVGTQFSPRSSYSKNTTLVIIDLHTFAVAMLETSKFVDSVVATGGPNRVWLLNSENDGPFTHQLLDLRDGGILLDTLDVPMWSQMIPAGEGNAPLINVFSNGVYEIEGTLPGFLGPGTVIAASAGGAIWSTCDNTLVCTTQLVTPNSSTPVPIDSDVLFNDPIVSVSPDGKFVAVVARDSDGVAVINTESGVSRQYEVGHVWSAEGLLFLDHRLLVWSEATLKLIDAEAGEVTYLGINPNHEYLVSSQ